ncbi:hypothetical protein Tco_0336705 [Tanacetum coccineum]
MEVVMTKERISVALVIGTCRVDKGSAAHDVSHCEVKFQMQGKRIENGAKTGFIRLNLVKSNYYSNYDEVVKCPRAYHWKEREKSSPTVPSDFIGPALTLDDVSPRELK